MKDEWFDGSLFDVSELDDSIKVEKEKKTYNTRKKEETDDNLFLPGLFDVEEDKTIYVESIPVLPTRSLTFLKSHNIVTVKDLLDFDMEGGHTLIEESGKITSKSIFKIIDDYKEGILVYDEEYIPQNDFPKTGIKVNEALPSPSLLSYSLSYKSINILFSIGIYTICSFVAFVRSYKLDTIPNIGDKTINEMKVLYNREKDKWKNGKCEIIELQEDVYTVPSPLSFVPTCKIDRSERLMFSFPKGLLKKLKRVNVTTLNSLKEYLSSFNIFDVPDISRQDIEIISEYLISRNNNPSLSIDTLDKNYKAIESIIEKEIVENKRITYLKREEGETLDGVGKLIGVTRERVRQIELEVTKRVLPYTSIILDLELESRKCIREEEIKSHFQSDDNSRIFIKAFKENKDVEYLECASLFLKRGEPSYDDRLKRVVEEYIGSSAELTDRMADLTEAFNRVGLEFIDLTVLLNYLSINGYYIYNTFVSKHKQKYRELAIKVIEKYFPDGINLTQLNNVVSPDMKRLKSLVKSEYNYTIDLPNRVFYVRLTDEDDLMLVDRSKFIASSLFHIDPEVLSHIEEAIINSPNNQIYYRTLYDELGDYLSTTNINNHYMLHGVIQHYLPQLCTTLRDYLVKDRDSFVVIPTKTKIEELIRSKNSALSIDEIKDHFPGFTDVMIIMPVSEDKNLIRLNDNKITLMELLDIDEEVKKGMRKLVLASINENNGYTNRYILFKELSNSEYSTMLAEKNLDSPASVFTLAGNLLDDEYALYNPHISKKTEGIIIKYQDVFMKYIGQPDIISYSQYINLCKKLEIPTMVRDVEFRNLISSYIRINKDEYMKKDVFLNTEGEIVSSVCDSLSSLMNDGFVSLLNFSSFSYLPPSKLEWNVFLLESIILASNRFDLFQGSVTDRRYVKTIVAEKGRYSSYAELVAELLIKRGKNTISERELKDILVINNLHLGKIPAEITNSEIFSYKDDLWHVVLDGHKA